ncbi:hypothetical protein NQZ68_010169 [Dissostichus eleginoides]|nr:hypothetical protein NQZ68_010169 [Dissostichus eleginoides]
MFLETTTKRVKQNHTINKSDDACHAHEQAEEDKHTECDLWRSRVLYGADLHGPTETSSPGIFPPSPIPSLSAVYCQPIYGSLAPPAPVFRKELLKSSLGNKRRYRFFFFSLSFFFFFPHPPLFCFPSLAVSTS